MSISERPAALESRERLGDTVQGIGGNLVTLVDRKNGYPSAYPFKRKSVGR